MNTLYKIYNNRIKFKLLKCFFFFFPAEYKTRNDIHIINYGMKKSYFITILYSAGKRYSLYSIIMMCALFLLSLSNITNRILVLHKLCELGALKSYFFFFLFTQ